MQLDKVEQIINVAGKTNFSIFELPREYDFAEILPNAYHLRALEEKTGISIEQIRDLEQLVSAKQSSDFYVVVESPEKMSIGAINFSQNPRRASRTRTYNLSHQRQLYATSNYSQSRPLLPHS